MGARSPENLTVPEGRGSTMQTPYDAVIFDMDGVVVTDTAALHAAAWMLMFDAVLSDPRAGVDGSPRPFDAVEDYRRYVDGRPREDGVVAFLDARGIEVPLGGLDDPTDSWTVHGLAARKNEIFLELTAAEGVRVLPGTAGLLQRLRAAGTPAGPGHGEPEPRGAAGRSRSRDGLRHRAPSADSFHDASHAVA